MMTRRFRPTQLLLTVLLSNVLLAGAVCAAELRFSRHLSDGMVLQRDKPVAITGLADKGADVTVSFAGQEKSAQAGDDGRWSVVLEPLAASAKGSVLSATATGAGAGGGPARLRDVLVGDVFLFARQSSIDVTLGQKGASGHKKNAAFRAITIKTVPATTPQSDLAEGATEGWGVVEKDSAAAMSAATYYFGRDLAARVDVPVGIIDLNMGAQFPLAWMSREALMETAKFHGKTDVEGNVERMENLAAVRVAGEPPPHKEVISSEPVEYALYPSAGYNAVLMPLRGLTLKGVVLQLGNNYPYMIYAGLEDAGTDRDRPELNRAYVETYNIRKVGFRMDSVTMPRVPKEWRTVLGDETLPIGLVMPPSSGLITLAMHGREMRELQRLTAQGDEQLNLILPGYENVPYSAQPSDEALLGQRSVAWALGAVYQTPGAPASGPTFARLESDMNTATVHFEAGTAEGLKAHKGGLDGFEVAGVEAEYSPATASIDGNVIRVKSDTITRIVHVRYNWKEAPDQGLVNGAGLPAIPFRTEEVAYDWFVTNSETDLPMEYSTPANEWAKSDVTLVNGQLKQHGYPNFTGWVGPVGIKTGPFGPNMGVRRVLPGSPADGKLFVGDVIYSANGNMLGDKTETVMAAALTESEAEAGGGKLTLGVRRGGKNIDVDIMLEVMGAYSATAPYDCPKTEKIVANLEQWLIARGGGAGYLNSESMFLLGTGNPEVQGYVRRVIYGILAKSDPTQPFEATKAGKSWHNSAAAHLLGEYYHATGDRNVLAHLKNYCDRLAATQHEDGGWRHNFPGGPSYGLIPNAGLPGVMGMSLANKAGVDINLEELKIGVDHFRDRRAETGFLIYGFGGCQREVPKPIDPAEMYSGHLESYNGGLSAAGILMGMEGYTRAAHLCSFISAYAWNNTFHGHGGNFWNNFWTPLGAHAHGRAAYINFMKGHRWYREMNRMYDGSLNNSPGDRVGGGTGLALVAPRQRLQITGAPLSPFATNAPAMLKPALDAHFKKDFAGCERLVNELIASGAVGLEDMPSVERLALIARDLQASIEFDLSKMERLIDAGQVYEASLDIQQLKGVLPEGHTHLAAIQSAISAKGGDAMKADQTRYSEQLASLGTGIPRADQSAAVERDWTCLVTEVPVDKKMDLGKVPAEEANTWRLSVIEGPAQAPEDWTSPGFDDSDWKETTLPISWRMYHTALLRTTFNVDDKNAFDGLRFRAWLFRQQGVEVYLNGTLIGKVNNLEKKTGNVENEFNASAVKLLKNGKNTLAVTSRHNWRWGMLFMKVYNDGFGFRLDASVKK